jgi:hypothetical protein
MGGGEVGLAEPSEAAGDVIVFDFDGTLVSRDSFFHFSVDYCIGRPARLLFVVGLLPLALLLALRSWKSAGSALLWGMTVGATTRNFALALSSYARRTLPLYTNDAGLCRTRSAHSGRQPRGHRDGYDTPLGPRAAERP